MLRAFVLAFHNDAGRQVGDTHRGISLVDMLATGTGGPVGIDFKVCAVDKDTEVFIVTVDFPEDQVFNVTMGPVLVAQPMKPMYGPMPKQGHPPMAEPYQQGPMQPMGQMDMGQPGMGQMDMGQPGMGQMNMGQPSMGQMDMSMSMGGKGYGEMGGMWGKPMAPKTYVPFYYEAGTLESVEGGNIETTLSIPRNWLVTIASKSCCARTTSIHIPPTPGSTTTMPRFVTAKTATDTLFNITIADRLPQSLKWLGKFFVCQAMR